MQPARFWRKEIKLLICDQNLRQQLDDDKIFHDFILENWIKTQEKIKKSQIPLKQGSIEAGELFIFSVGAFAFGQIEAATDILDTMPPTANIRHFSCVLNALLPGLYADPRKDPAAVRTWLSLHPTLSWNETEGVYSEA